MPRDEDPNESRQDRQVREAKAEQYWRETNALLGFWATLAAGVVTLLLFGLWATETPSPKAFTMGLLAGAAAGLLGALLGFLFGLPRGSNGQPVTGDPPAAANGAVSAATQQRAVNNNLLEISDWLTKIIVGAGLVGLTDLVRWVGEVGRRVGVAAGLEDGDTAAMFGGAILVFFFTWGFLFLYIQTRTIISVIFASTERSLLGFENARRAIDRQADDAPAGGEQRPAADPPRANVGTAQPAGAL